MVASAGSIRAGKAHVEMGLKGQTTVLKGLASLKAGIGNVAAGIAKAGIAAGAAVGALAGAGAVVLFKNSIAAASDFQETMSKFNVVFGENAAAMKSWGDTFASAVGRSKGEVASFLAGSQDLLVPMGLDPTAAMGMSKSLTQLTYDMASFNNKADADVMNDLQAALTGSGEVMKKYGVVLNETAIKQELLNQGLDPKNATEAQKAIARYNIILAGTTAAQGDAIRTADGFANQTKTLKATWDDFQVMLGEKLLPMMTELVSWINAFASAMGSALSTTGEVNTGMVQLGDGGQFFISVLTGINSTINGIIGTWKLLVAGFRSALWPLTQIVRGLAVAAKYAGWDNADAIIDAVDEWNKGIAENFQAGIDKWGEALDNETPDWAKKIQDNIAKDRAAREEAKKLTEQMGTPKPLQIAAVAPSAPVEKEKKPEEALSRVADQIGSKISELAQPETLTKGSLEAAQAVDKYRREQLGSEQKLLDKADRQIELLRRIEAKPGIGMA